ncbi:hypothetical protein IE077_003571 [Cardiosporidium cionae]|uniref:RAP domain-containing protein n=1 Tax=Cardiosporidium cionae TaxID=476202 RepID=A0ABQ7JES4_9APIC|nr:hypothetical protein IE077_003571 [Cardiosporidium cionae]|eukprot:KAF8822511.1 hypothetical protein IE077_003571 [Cardiosporidium cionae]
MRNDCQHTARRSSGLFILFVVVLIRFLQQDILIFAASYGSPVLIPLYLRCTPSRTSYGFPYNSRSIEVEAVQPGHCSFRFFPKSIKEYRKSCSTYYPCQDNYRDVGSLAFNILSCVSPIRKHSLLAAISRGNLEPILVDEFHSPFNHSGRKCSSNPPLPHHDSQAELLSSFLDLSSILFSPNTRPSFPNGDTQRPYCRAFNNSQPLKLRKKAASFSEPNAELKRIRSDHRNRDASFDRQYSHGSRGITNLSDSYFINEKLINAKVATDILDILYDSINRKAKINYVNYVTAFHRFAKHVRHKKFGRVHRYRMPAIETVGIKMINTHSEPPRFNKNSTVVRKESQTQNGFNAVNSSTLSLLLQSSKFCSLLKCITHEVKTSEYLRSKHIANIAWAMAVLGLKSHELWALLDERILKLKESFRPQEVSILLWAYATGKTSLNETVSEYLLSKVKRFLELHEFKPQEICNTIWALVALKIDERDLYVRLIEEALRISHNLAPIDISTVAHSLASYGHGVLPLLNTFLEATLGAWYDRIIKNSSFNTSSACFQIKANADTASTVSENYFYGDHLQQLHTAFLFCNESFSLSQPSRSISLDASKFPCTPTISPVEEEANCSSLSIENSPIQDRGCLDLRRILKFTAQDWSNIVWSCATAGVGMFNISSELAYPLVCDDNAQQEKCKNLCRNLSLQPIQPTFHTDSTSSPHESIDTVQIKFFTRERTERIAIVSKLTTLLLFQLKYGRLLWADFSAQSLANLLWSYAVLNYYPKELFEKGIEEASRRRTSIHEFPQDAKQLAPRHRAQLFQAILAYALALKESKEEKILSNMKESNGPVDEFFLKAYSHVPQKCVNDWQLQLARMQKRLKCKESISSALHRSVSEDLNQLKIVHSNEYFIADSFLVDIAFPKQLKILEVYGPSHFWYQNNTAILTPRTVFKQRLLRQLGWTIVAIPYFLYDGTVQPFCSFSTEERMDFLKSLLS